jgi:positive regulator of sigma E activity
MNDEVIAAGAQKVVYGGGTAAFLGGLSANEIAAFGGLLVAVLGLLVQFYYKRKHDKREQRLHEAQLAALKDDEYGAPGA